MELQNKYIAYVNAYYAVQEALDAAKRQHEPEPEGLDSFCRRANPFLWDEEASADRSIYEGFSRQFRNRFDADASTAEDAYDFVRSWLKSLEGDEFGRLLLDAFDSVATRDGFVRSFDPVREQVELRRVVNEMMPQDRPVAPPEAVPTSPATSGALSVAPDTAPVAAALLAPHDVNRQAELSQYLRQQTRSGALQEWLWLEEGSPVATVGIVPVSLPPEAGHASRTVALLVLSGGTDGGLDSLLLEIASQHPDWEVQDASL